MTVAGRSIRLAVLGTALALAGVLGAASAASAHDQLASADPAADSTTGEVTAVTLTFSGDLIGGAGADIIEVTGPDGRYYETACAELAGTQLSVPVALGTAGRYEVAWRAVSSDGHPVSGTYGFTYAPDATSSPAAAGSAKPACAEAGTEPTAPETANPADSGVWIGLGIGLAAVVAASVGAWLIVRRRPNQGDGRNRYPEDGR